MTSIVRIQSLAFILTWLGSLVVVRTGAAEPPGEPARSAPSSANQSFGYIDLQGRTVIPPTFQDARAFSEGLAGVKLNDKWGYINKAGEWAIQPQFAAARAFSEGLAAIRDADGHWGFIDRRGTLVVPTRFDEAGGFSAGRVRVKSGKRWEYLNANGNRAINQTFAQAEDFSEGVAAVCSDREADLALLAKFRWAGTTCLYGFVDPTGDFVIEPRFYAADSFSEGLAAVKSEGKWGYADKAGRMVIPPQFDEQGKFAEGLALVDGGGLSAAWLLHEGTAFAKRGYIDREGRWVFYTRVRRYLYDSPFSEGVTPFQDSKDAYGYADKAGKIVIRPQFGSAHGFSEGLAAVAGMQGGCGYIDHGGRMILKLPSGCGQGFSEGLAVYEVPR